jgi:hypothetical protein
LLDDCIHTAIHNNTFRRDDMEFTFAARVLYCFPDDTDDRAGPSVFPSQILNHTGSDLLVSRTISNLDFLKQRRSAMRCCVD